MKNDKILHFLIGLMLSISTYVFTQSVTWSLTLVTIVGLGKEIYDSLGHGTCDLKDFIATLLGGMVGILLSLIVYSVL